MTDCEITILGCGGSGGVPLAGGYWGDCNPDNPKNRRTRASIAIQTKTTCVVIDTGPDFHQQTLNHGIHHVNAALYTHSHADHVNGIDDLRYVAIAHRRRTDDENFRMPIYTDAETLDILKVRFHYMFETSPDGLYVPLVEDNIIGEEFSPITVDDITLQPFKQTHGAGRSLGFRIGDVGYSTDVSDLDDTALNTLKGIKTWIVDCGQFGSEYITVHANEARVYEWNKIVGAQNLILTHLTPRIDYDYLQAQTPDYIEPAFDGMKIPVKIPVKI